jgi:hypothetical protein
VLAVQKMKSIVSTKQVDKFKDIAKIGCLDAFTSYPLSFGPHQIEYGSTVIDFEEKQDPIAIRNSSIAIPSGCTGLQTQPSLFLNVPEDAVQYGTRYVHSNAKVYQAFQSTCGAFYEKEMVIGQSHLPNKYQVLLYKDSFQKDPDWTIEMDFDESKRTSMLLTKQYVIFLIEMDNDRFEINVLNKSNGSKKNSIVLGYNFSLLKSSSMAGRVLFMHIDKEIVSVDVETGNKETIKFKYENVLNMSISRNEKFLMYNYYNEKAGLVIEDLETKSSNEFQCHLAPFNDKDIKKAIWIVSDVDTVGVLEMDVSNIEDFFEDFGKGIPLYQHHLHEMKNLQKATRVVKGWETWSDEDDE